MPRTTQAHAIAELTGKVDQLAGIVDSLARSFAHLRDVDQPAPVKPTRVTKRGDANTPGTTRATRAPRGAKPTAPQTAELVEAIATPQTRADKLADPTWCEKALTATRKRYEVNAVSIKATEYERGKAMRLLDRMDEIEARVSDPVTRMRVWLMGRAEREAYFAGESKPRVRTPAPAAPAIAMTAEAMIAAAFPNATPAMAAALGAALGAK